MYVRINYTASVNYLPVVIGATIKIKKLVYCSFHYVPVPDKKERSTAFKLSQCSAHTEYFFCYVLKLIL